MEKLYGVDLRKFLDQAEFEFAPSQRACHRLVAWSKRGVLALAFNAKRARDSSGSCSVSDRALLVADVNLPYLVARRASKDEPSTPPSPDKEMYTAVMTKQTYYVIIDWHLRGDTLAAVLDTGEIELWQFEDNTINRLSLKHSEAPSGDQPAPLAFTWVGTQLKYSVSEDPEAINQLVIEKCPAILTNQKYPFFDSGAGIITDDGILFIVLFSRNWNTISQELAIPVKADFGEMTLAAFTHNTESRILAVASKTCLSFFTYSMDLHTQPSSKLVISIESLYSLTPPDNFISTKLLVLQPEYLLVSSTDALTSSHRIDRYRHSCEGGLALEFSSSELEAEIVGHTPNQYHIKATSHETLNLILSNGKSLMLNGSLEVVHTYESHSPVILDRGHFNQAPPVKRQKISPNAVYSAVAHSGFACAIYDPKDSWLEVCLLSCLLPSVTSSSFYSVTHDVIAQALVMNYDLWELVFFLRPRFTASLALQLAELPVKYHLRVFSLCRLLLPAGGGPGDSLKIFELDTLTNLTAINRFFRALPRSKNMQVWNCFNEEVETTNPITYEELANANLGELAIKENDIMLLIPFFQYVCDTCLTVLRRISEGNGLSRFILPNILIKSVKEAMLFTALWYRLSNCQKHRPDFLVTVSEGPDVLASLLNFVCLSYDMHVNNKPLDDFKQDLMKFLSGVRDQSSFLGPVMPGLLQRMATKGMTFVARSMTSLEKGGSSVENMKDHVRFLRLGTSPHADLRCCTRCGRNIGNRRKNQSRWPMWELLWHEKCFCGGNWRKEVKSPASLAAAVM